MEGGIKKDVSCFLKTFILSTHRYELLTDESRLISRGVLIKSRR